MNTSRFLKVMLYVCLSVMALSAKAAMLATIEGKTFLFQVANIKNSNNPNANQIYIMHFGKDTYSYEVVSKQKIVKGNYHYQVLDQYNGIALISCHEIEDDIHTNYTLLLNAENDKAGLYIYKQTSGSINPQQRLNFSYYTILESF